MAEDLPTKMKRLTDEAHGQMICAINSFKRALISAACVNVEEATRMAVSGAVVVKVKEEEVQKEAAVDVDMAEAVHPVTPSVEASDSGSELSEASWRRGPQRVMPRSPFDVGGGGGGGSSGSAAPAWGLPTRVDRGLEPRQPWRKRGGKKQRSDLEYNKRMAAVHREKGKGKGKGKV